MDCEDSVAAVDGADKTLAYRNWLGLMKRDLSEEIVKGSETFTRRLNSDIAFTTAQGAPAYLKGRSLMLVRNVGHLMTTPAVLAQDGAEIGEGLLDALCTAMIAIANTTDKLLRMRQTDTIRTKPVLCLRNTSYI